MHETPFDRHGSRIRWSDLPGRLPARVFLHGMGGNGWAAFGHVAGHPAMGGHRSLVVDLPGHALSDRPADFGYSLDEHAAAVAKVCEAAGVSGIDLVGHSLGGDISVVMAARNPGLVARLVIAEANLDPLPASPTGGRTSQQIAAQSEAEFVATGYQHHLDTNRWWAPLLRLCDARAVHRSAVGLVTGTRPTMRELFTAMDIPRTFIVGDRGEPLADPDGLAATGVRIITIPNAGHILMDDAPDLFVEALASALPG